MVASDEQLAQGLQQGERGTLPALVERHYGSLMGYLYRITRGDRALAQDLAQETFLRALRGISSYQYPRPFKPWLYAIATNLARNHYTSADARRTKNADEDADYANDDTPDAALLERDEAQAVIAALDTLPDHQREVIVLSFYQSLSLQAIADTLDIPLGTVKSRLSIGVKRLRERMEAQNDVSER
jgi:RNA polymerase sigma-70 factor (ECF subfamily)